MTKNVRETGRLGHAPCKRPVLPRLPRGSLNLITISNATHPTSGHDVTSSLLPNLQSGYHGPGAMPGAGDAEAAGQRRALESLRHSSSSIRTPRGGDGEIESYGGACETGDGAGWLSDQERRVAPCKSWGEAFEPGQAGVRGGPSRCPALQTLCADPVRLQAVARCRGQMWMGWERVEGGDPGNSWRGGQDPPEVTLGYEPLTQQLSLWVWGGARLEAGSCQANEKILSSSSPGSQ